MKNKKTIFLIFATLATIVLAVVAVVTSMRLKELATVPVTPNVPTSQPLAAEINQVTSTDLSTNTCETAFTVEEKVVEKLACNDTCIPNVSTCPTGLSCELKPGTTDAYACLNASCTNRTNCECVDGLACTTKSAYKTSVAVANKMAENAVIARGDTLVYEIAYENTGDATNSATITDTIPVGLEFIEADKPCVYSDSTRIVTCTGISVASGVVKTTSITVKVLTDAIAGSIKNTADVVPTLGEKSICSIALKLEVPDIVIPQCNDDCTVKSDCPTDLVCHEGSCRKEACKGEKDCVCPVATATPTPTSTSAPALKCNDYCANTAECPSGYTCQGNQCRNAECPLDNDCVCENPPGCNETCNSNNATNECVGGYICDATTNTCRNSACTEETDCTCAIAGTITAPVETLPAAGNPIPAFLFLGAGALLLILGVLAVGL